jgi:hypothetical protein
MRCCLVALLLFYTLACSPEREEKVEPKLEVHTQPALAAGDPPANEDPPASAVETDSQSFYDGMLALCESYEKAPKSDSPVESQKLLHAWIGEKVTNKKVREVFTLVGTMPPKQRSGMLRAAAAKVGITSCSLAGPDPLEVADPAAPL